MFMRVYTRASAYIKTTAAIFCYVRSTEWSSQELQSCCESVGR